MRKFRIPFFRIFYSSTYTTLLVAAFVLLAATPADHVFQILTNHKIANLFVIGGTYAATATLALFIYASRLYTNRTTLAAIPRSYLPIEKGEVPKNVRRMIVKNRQRSALIAWESRPRDLQEEIKQNLIGSTVDGEPQSRPGTSKSKGSQSAIKSICPISAGRPPWGEVSHPGWSSPTSGELADLEFDTVVCELPNLIEAKVVSLAPPDPTFDFMIEFHDAVPPPPDPRVVAYLQRTPATGLREYMGYLDSLGLTGSTDLCTQFMAQYEYARFSDIPLTERQFRRLMDTFSMLLSEMTGLSEEILTKAQSEPASGAGSMRSVRRQDPPKPVASSGASIASSSSRNSTESVVHHHASGQWRPP